MPVMVAAALVVSDADREVLERWARSTVEPHRRVLQARAPGSATGPSGCTTAGTAEPTADMHDEWHQANAIAMSNVMLGPDLWGEPHDA